VGNGTPAPDNTLTVNGTADKPGGGSWGIFSDSRLKTVEATYDAGLDAILRRVGSISERSPPALKRLEQ